MGVRIWPDGGDGQALTQAAIVARVFARRTRAVEVDLADATDVVLWDIPSPGRDRVPLLDSDLHGEWRSEW